MSAPSDWTTLPPALAQIRRRVRDRARRRAARPDAVRALLGDAQGIHTLLGQLLTAEEARTTEVRWELLPSPTHPQLTCLQVHAGVGMFTWATGLNSQSSDLDITHALRGIATCLGSGIWIAWVAHSAPTAGPGRAGS